nr:MAG TPA: Glycine rich protein family [Caudoviricetes sp.]
MSSNDFLFICFPFFTTLFTSSLSCADCFTSNQLTKLY